MMTEHDDEEWKAWSASQEGASEHASSKPVRSSKAKLLALRAMNAPASISLKDIRDLGAALLAYMEQAARNANDRAGKVP